MSEKLLNNITHITTNNIPTSMEEGAIETIRPRGAIDIKTKSNILNFLIVRTF